VIDVKDDTRLPALSVGREDRAGSGRDAMRPRQGRAGAARYVARAWHLSIARIVVAKDPLVAEHKVSWSVRNAAGELWRDRIGSAWVDAYNDSVWIYAAQLAEEAVHMGFAEVQFDYVRFPDEPHERLMTALFRASVRVRTSAAACGAT